MHQSDLHFFVASQYIQDRLDQAETGRLAKSAREPRRPRLRWTFRVYSVPKMRSPASPKPGRM